MDNHQLIRDCINNINAYVVIVGLEGKVIFANERTLNLFLQIKNQFVKKVLQYVKG